MRVLVGEMPEIMRRIVTDAVSGEADMELVFNETPRPAPSSSPVMPDVVVVGAMEPAGAGVAEAMLGRWPKSRILMIATDGRRAVMYELRPHKRELGELSPGDLVETIRSSGRGSGGSPGTGHAPGGD
jgi:hypothetical protein